MAAESLSRVEQPTARLGDIRRRMEWCQRWAARRSIGRAQITQEWINLLADVDWLLEAIGDGAEGSRVALYEEFCEVVAELNGEVDRGVALEARLRVAGEALQEITPEALEKFMVPTDNYSDEWRCAVYECGEWMRERIAAALGSVGVAAVVIPEEEKDEG